MSDEPAPTPVAVTHEPERKESERNESERNESERKDVERAELGADRPAARPRNARVWRVLRVVAAIGFFAFFIATMTFRFHNAQYPYSLHGDQHQSIGHYWRFAVPGAIPPGHLLSDYAFVYHSPPLWVPVMVVGSMIAGPLTTSKVLGVLAYLLYGLGAVVIVGRRTDWLLGWLTGILVIRNPPDLVEQVTGGMSRSMAPFMLYLFLWAFHEKRHKTILALLVVQAGTYPAIVIPCGICYGLYCVIKGPMPDRLRRCAGMFVAGLLVIGLGESQEMLSPKWWGHTVSYEEADKMPAWHSGGRFPEIPHRTFESLMTENLVRAYKDLGHHALPAAVMKPVQQHAIIVFVVVPILFALLAALTGFLIWFFSPYPPPNAEPPLKREFPWAWVYLFISSLFGYVLVRLFAFKLFLPSRQIGFTTQYILVTMFPVLVWWGVAALWPRRRALVLLVTALVTIVPAFLFRGDGLGTNGGGYSSHLGEERFWEAIRKLPLTDEVACNTHFCETMMPLGQHAPFAARNLAHPFRKGYYEEVERRFVAMHSVLYATSGQEVLDFWNKEHVRWFAYDTGDVAAPDARQFQPARDKIGKIFARGKGKIRLLGDPPPEAVVFRDGRRVLLDLSKFPVDYTGAFIGPLNEKGER